MQHLILSVMAPVALIATLAIEPAAAAIPNASLKADSISIEAAMRGGHAGGIAVRGRGVHGRTVVVGRGRAFHGRGGGVVVGRRFYAGGPYYGGGGYYGPGYIYGRRVWGGGGRGFHRGGAVVIGRRGFVGGRRFAGRTGGFRRR